MVLKTVEARLTKSKFVGVLVKKLVVGYPTYIEILLGVLFWEGNSRIVLHVDLALVLT